MRQINNLVVRKKYKDDELIQKVKDLLVEFEIPQEAHAAYLDYL